MPTSDKPLPEFAPPTREELRGLWRTYPDADLRRLILEIEHLRRVVRKTEAHRLVIARGYKDQNIEQVIALENLRSLMREEKIRLGLPNH